MKRYAVAVRQKILWLVAAALLVGPGFWLGLAMPSQGWAQWDGRRWQVVAEGWAVLWRGWPLALFGALVGFAAAWVGLAFALQHAKEADFRAEIAWLTRRRAEQARQDAEAAVNQAALRARNAVCAAERIKRRVEGKKRLDARTSAP